MLNVFDFIRFELGILRIGSIFSDLGPKGFLMQEKVSTRNKCCSNWACQVYFRWTKPNRQKMEFEFPRSLLIFRSFKNDPALIQNPNGPSYHYAAYMGDIIVAVKLMVLYYKTVSNFKAEVLHPRLPKYGIFIFTLKQSRTMRQNIE